MSYSDSSHFRAANPVEPVVASEQKRKKTVAKRLTLSKDRGCKNLSLKKLADRLITRCMDALEKKELKVTVADLIRFRDLHQRLAPTKPNRDVTWFDGWDEL
jgi:hypothetical protein